MTDSRLREEWLGNMKFDGLSDAAWRVFTNGLIWCNKNGTDGFVPNRYLKHLHPDGEQPAAYRELEDESIWKLGELGAFYADWAGVLGQSTAEEVAAYKANAANRSRKYRAELKTRLENKNARVTRDATRDDTRDVREHVGKGKGVGQGDGDRSDVVPVRRVG